MLDTPRIIQTEAQHTAVIHLTVPRTEIGQVMGTAISEVLAAIKAQGLAPVGPCYSFHFRRPAETFDFEVGFPLSSPIRASGRVRPGTLPAVPAAHTIYHGAYEGLGAAWGELMAWVEQQQLPAAESLWEIYLRGPESSPDPTTWRTALYRPLQPHYAEANK